MELINKNPDEILNTLNEYQIRDLNKLKEHQAEINKFYYCDLIAEYEIYEDSEYFRNFKLTVQFNGIKFDAFFNERNGYNFYLKIDLPFIDYNDKGSFIKNNPEPKNAYKLSQTKIDNLLNYEIDKFIYLNNLSESKAQKIKEKEDEINRLFKKKEYSFSNGRFKLITIEQKDLIYQAILHDSGYIEEKLSIKYSSDKINQFYQLTK